MISSFLSTFFACLVGAGVGQTVRWRIQAPERRHLGASVVETVTIAFAFSSTQLVFGSFPQLKDGWAYFPTLAVVIAVIWFPGSCVADWMRDRRRP